MSSPQVRPSRLRKWLLLLLILSAVLVGLIATAPMLISGPGRGLVVERINATLNGRIELDGLDIGWAGPQRIRGVTLLDAAGERVLEIGAIDIDGTLLDLVFSPHCRGEIRIRDVAGDIAIDAGGGTNLGRIAGPGETAADSQPATFETLRGMDCRLRLDNAGFGLSAPGMEPVRVSDLAARLRLNGLDSLELEGDAALSQGATRGRLELRADAAGLFDAQARPAPAEAEFDFELELADFPVDMADRLAGLNGRLRALLGPSLDQRLTGEWRGASGRLALDMQSSAEGRAQLEFEIDDGTVALQRPARVTLVVAPDAWPLLAPAGADLLAPFGIDARLETLTFDPDNSIAAVDAELNIGDIELQADDPRAGRMALREIRLVVSSDDLRDGVAVELDTLAEQDGRGGRARLEGRVDEFLTAELAPDPESLRVEIEGRLTDLPLAVLDQIAGGDGLLPAAFGPRMNAEFNLDGVPGQGRGKVDLSAKSAHLRMDISGNLDDEGLLIDTGRIGMQVQPPLAARFTDTVSLSSGAGLDMQVQRFRVPYRDGALAWPESRIELVTELAETRAKLGPGRGAVDLAGTLNARSERLADGLALDFDGRLGDAQASGRVRAEAQLDGEMALRQAVRVELPDFPTGVLDRIAGQQGRLASLLGASMTAEIELEPKNDGAFTADAALDAELMRTRLVARYAAGRLSLEPDARLEWDLTPAAFAGLQDQQVWTLVQPASVSVRLDRLEAELDTDGLDLRSLELLAEADIPELVIRRGDESRLRLSGMDIVADARPLGEGLELRASGDLAGGDFDSQTTLTGIVNDAGELAPGDANLQTDTRLEEVPSRLVLALADLDPSLGPALGSSVRARVSGRLPGDLEVSAEGTNTRVSADASIDTNGVLGLNRDAEMTLNITPPLVDGYLARLHPFLSDVRSAEQPIRLSLSSDGFRMPLTEYRPEDIRASGRLEIGTLNMNRGAITLGLFGALRQLGGNVRMGSNFQARFTPLEFSIRDGEVETNDLWMQMEDLMLGARALVRLPEQVDGVPLADMVFAVPGQTLRGLPRIADALEPDTILTTSSSGPLDRISPNFSKMFAGLATQSAVERVAGESEVGKAIGGLLGRAAGGGRRESASPDGRDTPRAQGETRSRWPNMPPVETDDGSGEGTGR